MEKMKYTALHEVKVGDEMSTTLHPENDEEIDVNDTRMLHRTSKRPFNMFFMQWTKSFLLHATIFAIAVAVSVQLVLLIEKRWSREDYTFTDCGTTPDEARARGCIYEPMQRSWIPPECYFPEPADEYDVFRDRVWYDDAWLTIPSSVESLESGDTTLTYTRYWHDEHCAYVLRKMALAVHLGKKMINSIPANIHHANHCAKAIAARVVNSYNASFLETDRTMTESQLKFETCVPLQVSDAPWQPYQSSKYVRAKSMFIASKVIAVPQTKAEEDVLISAEN
jgi:hypothetical protein